MKVHMVEMNFCLHFEIRSGDKGILESGKKAERMVKEHITTTIKTGMKEGGGIVRNMDREQCTSMETSI